MDFPTPQVTRHAHKPRLAPFPRLSNLTHRYFDRENAPLILDQNAPNPHNGETCIPFTLLYPADVRLEILDMLGRKMAVIVRKGLSSGEHSIQVNLRGLRLPSGDYPYHLQAISALGVHNLSRVMTLITNESK